MKTRIKEIKYGDGKTTYKAQWTFGFKSIFYDFEKDCRKYSKLIIFLYLIFIIPLTISCFSWNEAEYEKLDDAKKHIDDIYDKIKSKKEKKEKEKLAKKVVSKTYIKYP